jgi:ParB-like chromosome segregation protein Spo0J
MKLPAEVKNIITKLMAGLDTPARRQMFIGMLREYLHDISDLKDPIDHVRWVPIEMVQSNNYNPNSVASNEMRLLHTSISHDGYTQPVVTIWDEKLGKYIIVDGFHRYTTMRNFPDIKAARNGLLPIVVIDKPIGDRMASTIRHNRARGKHSVAGMGSMVFELLKLGWGDNQICNELGLEPDELLRLKHITGFAKLFKDAKFSPSWVTENQIKIQKSHERKAAA